MPDAPEARDGADDGTHVQRQTPTHLFSTAGLPVVPGYAVSREIARGGMGVVYAAHDPAFDREVAIKVMHPGQDAERFVVESKVTAQLPHPGVPPVYAIGTLPDGRPFLAMKLIQGHTLADELKSNDLPRLLGVFEAICQTVGFAHSKGIVHRDLKPANVMVGAFGEVLVMDWGLAKELSGGHQPPAGLAPGADAPRTGVEETRAGQVKGTPAYMAPEQARGEPVGPPTDVFALGGILAVILTGKPPFLGDTVLDTVIKAAQAELSECFEQLDTCPADAELVAVAKRCLAAGARGRYADGEAVATAVAAYRAGVEERLRQAERDRAVRDAEAREQRKRRRVQRALVATVAAFAAAGVAVAWYSNLLENRRKIVTARLEGERDADQRNQAERARDAVHAGRKLADDLRKKYKFKEADEALVQAARMAEGGAPELLAEVEQARAALAFVERLDDIRYRKWKWVSTPGGGGDFHPEMALPLYRKAFADRGINLEALDPAGAANRIIDSKDIRGELVAAVDDWALHEPDEKVRNRLLEVARRADPGPWLDRLRDPAVRGDKVAVAKLAAEVNPGATSPAAVAVLAALMERTGLDPAPILWDAHVRDPANFELAFALGQWHLFKKDGLEIGPYEAARAIRPESVPVLLTLGVSLDFKGNLDGAIAMYKEAIRLDPRSADAHINLGGAFEEKHNIPGATAEYEKAIALDRTDALPHALLGDLSLRMGDVPKARAALTEAARLNPGKYGPLLAKVPPVPPAPPGAVKP